MQPKKEQEQLGLAALYCRLSRDDGAEGDSNSVANQKRLLQKYAKENGLGNTRFYVDDGYTGTNFNRPSFQKMKDARRYRNGVYNSGYCQRYVPPRQRLSRRRLLHGHIFPGA